jgi:hypothetical protein
MSNRQLDAALHKEFVDGEIACCECGFHRNGKHHPKIQCPRSGRCGECGNEWPCAEHAPKASKENTLFAATGSDVQEQEQENQTDVDEVEDAISFTSKMYLDKVKELRVYGGAARILIQRIANGEPFGKKMAQKFLKLKLP